VDGPGGAGYAPGMAHERPCLVLAALLTAACGGSKPAPPPAAGNAPAVEIPGGDFGVPECDGFAKRYLACLDKVPEGSRGLARQAFDQTLEHWRFAANKPEGRAQLAVACVQQEKATRAAMERYDCDW